MGMNDHASNLVKGSAAYLFSILADLEKTTITGQVPSVRSNVNNLIHSSLFRICGWVARFSSSLDFLSV